MANGLMKSYVQIKIGPVGISITEMQRDFDNLMAAKRAELVRAGVSDPSPSALRKAISREELAHHCRRKTRGSSDTINLIEALVLAVSPATDSLGGRLFNDKMQEIWAEQKCHVDCLQDPPVQQVLVYNMYYME